MVTINFISVKEKTQRVENSKIISSKINSENEKLTRITYLNLEKSDIEQFNRRSEIKMDLYSKLKLSNTYNQWLRPSSNSEDDFTFQQYHSRNLKFEVNFIGSLPHLEIFRYKDIDGFQYFTVINRNSNQIIEAGFIDRDLIGNGSDVVIDVPDEKLNQFVLFPVMEM